MRTIITNIEGKKNQFPLLSALVAMGYHIHGKGSGVGELTVEEFLRHNSSLLAICIISHRGLKEETYISGYYGKQHGDEVMPIESFLLEAARMMFSDDPEPKVVVLNSEHTAVVHKDIVKVGCQTIPADKVLEVAEAIKELRK